MSTPAILNRGGLEDLKRGYVETADAYACLFCAHRAEKGVVQPLDGTLYLPERYLQVHVERAHGAVFDALLGLGKKVTGLTDVQRRLLERFQRGDGDEEVRSALGIGSTSTIRNHRFLLKERERQARVFLAIMELLKPAERKAGRLVEADGPFHITTGEKERFLAKYFPDGLDGPLTRFPSREKQRYVVVQALADRFEPARRYTEKEVNAVLTAAWEDFAMLRRYLVSYGFLGRRDDGSEYWKAGDAVAIDRREELKLQAREVRTVAGVFCIRNERNGKQWVESTRNVKTMNGQRFQLQEGMHRNKALQRDWTEYGEDAFSTEVLEEVAPDVADVRKALVEMKKRWLERLQPFGDRGYN